MKKKYSKRKYGKSRKYSKRKYSKRKYSKRKYSKRKYGKSRKSYKQRGGMDANRHQTTPGRLGAVPPTLARREEQAQRDAGQAQVRAEHAEAAARRRIADAAEQDTLALQQAQRVREARRRTRRGTSWPTKAAIAATVASGIAGLGKMMNFGETGDQVAMQDTQQSNEGFLTGAAGGAAAGGDTGPWMLGDEYDEPLNVGQELKRLYDDNKNQKFKINMDLVMYDKDTMGATEHKVGTIFKLSTDPEQRAPYAEHTDVLIAEPIKSSMPIIRSYKFHINDDILRSAELL